MGTESRTGEKGKVAFNLELWCAGYFHINFLIYSPQQLRKGTIIIPIFQPKKLSVRACLARERAKIWAQVLLILKSKLCLSFFFLLLFPQMVAGFYTPREGKPSEGLVLFFSSDFSW